MGLSELIVWFALASIAGWLFESLYAMIRTGHWERRGFLYGPLCPIYGAGVVAALLLFDRSEVADGTFPVWAVFLVSMVGSAVLEYVVSLVLERLFGAVWWDYSNLPLNLNGRICLPASLLFGVAGVVISYWVIPLIHVVDGLVAPVVFEALALAFAFVLAIDLTITVLGLSDLMEKIAKLDKDINQRADDRLQQATDAMRSLPDKAQTSGAVALARMQETARGLTKRQTEMLIQLKRFSSARIGSRVVALRDFLRDSGWRNGD